MTNPGRPDDAASDRDALLELLLADDLVLGRGGEGAVQERVGARTAPHKGEVVRLAAAPEAVHVFSNKTEERLS